MDALLIFVVFGLVFAWCIRWLLQYTAQTVGGASPLHARISYAYKANDFWMWRETPFLAAIILLLLFVCWKLITLLPTATHLWQYGLTVAILILTGLFLWFVAFLFLVENRLWTMMRDTTVVLDSTTQSLTLWRNDVPTVLTKNNVAAIEYHWLRQGKLGYQFYRFIDQNGRSSTFYDYGKGLSFGIEAYFKSTPMRSIEHRYPFRDVPFT